MTRRNENNLLEDEECAEIVQKILVKKSMEGYSLVRYEVVPIDEPNGYMGQYFSLKTIVAHPILETRIINFFAKIPPPADSPQYEFSTEQGSFKKEVDLYTNVFPKILGDLKSLTVPECFFGSGGEIIVLEDMASSGFVMPNKLEPFDLAHCIIIFKTLAKFHSKSIIYEETTKKNIYNEFAYCLHETLWPLNKSRAKRMFDAAVKGTSSLIDLITCLDNGARAKFKEKVIALSSTHCKSLLPSKKFRNVICHGDLWTNNILFQYDSTGKPTACCLIDFQLARYNLPAHDLMTFLQFTTTRELRDNHGHELFKIYHDAITTSLADAQLNSTKLFPFDDFLHSIQEINTSAMVHGILNTPIMLLDSQAVSKYFKDQPQLLETLLYIDRTPLVCEQFKEIREYRERILDSLLELHSKLI